MKNVPKRSVRCETTTARAGQGRPSAERYGEVDRIATPQRT